MNNVTAVRIAVVAGMSALFAATNLITRGLVALAAGVGRRARK